MQNHEQNNNLKRNNAIWGLLLIVGGVLFLLQNFGLFSGLSALVWIVLFGAGGLFFLYLFLNDRQAAWWAAIPGCTLLGLATISLISEFGPAALDPVTGPLFLASIGMGFVLVYLANSEHWWALIPGGVMVTLAAVAGVDELGLPNFESGGLFFIGLGVTFALVALLPKQHQQNTRWALIPAAVLLIMGILIGVSFEAALGYIWPFVLIVGGAVLLWRALLAKQS